MITRVTANGDRVVLWRSETEYVELGLRAEQIAIGVTHYYVRAHTDDGLVLTKGYPSLDDAVAFIDRFTS